MSKRPSTKSDQLSFATTLHVRDHCLCLALQRASRLMARRYDEALRPAHLTNGQFSLLMSLNRAKPPNVAEVAALLGLDRTTLTANLKPLARRGLLKISVDEEDRRSRRLQLTWQGRAILKQALPLWLAQQAETERLVKPAEFRHLQQALRALE